MLGRKKQMAPKQRTLFLASVPVVSALPAENAVIMELPKKDPAHGAGPQNAFAWIKLIKYRVPCASGY